MSVARRIAKPIARGITAGDGGSAVSSVLILDTYTTSYAAYSLRKLRTAYAGSAIRVRRSSDNTEQDIGFTGNGLDTASLLSFCGAGNGFVAKWYDQKGSADLIQATTTNQLQVVSSGAVTTSGTLSKPTLTASGSQHMTATVSITGTAASAAFIARMDSASAINARFVGTRNATFADYENSSTCIFAYKVAAANTWGGLRNGAGLSSKAANTAILQQIASVYDGTNHTVHVDGDAGTATASTGTFSSTSLMLLHADGISQGTGYFSELILSNSAFSSTDRNAVKTDQATFYGITVA